MEDPNMAKEDPIGAAIAAFGQVCAYRVTLRSRGVGFSEEMRYYYRDGCVRMELLQPHRGVVIVYDPAMGEARVRPVGLLKKAVLKLKTDSDLIRSAKGHRVDRSDIGSLLAAVDTLRRGGLVEVLGDEEVGERQTTLVRVTGKEQFAVENVHKYHLWFDRQCRLPVKMIAYDLQDRIIEEVRMDDLETGCSLADDLFRL